MNVFQLAWRNMWRNTRRTAVTVGAMTFALWVMVLYSGLVAGYLAGMENDILDYEVGDAQIFESEYRETPSLYSFMKDSDTVVAALEAEGLTVSARLLAGGLGATGESSAGVQLRGVNVEADKKALRLHERLAEGEWLDPTDPQGVVLGYRLARVLGASPGSELVVLSQGTDGSMANALFTVRGVLYTVGEGTDRSAVIMNAAAFRDLMVLPEGAHQIVVRKPREMAPADFEALLGDMVPQHDVQTWRQLMPTVAQMLDSTRGMIWIVFFIIYLAIGVLILNAMLMAVFERIREFGVLKAIGVSPGAVLQILVIESALQVVMAIALGLTLTIPFAFYMAKYGLAITALGGMSMMGVTLKPVWYGIFDAEAIAGPVVVLVTIVSIAILYPAAKAAMINPLDAMRYR